MDSSAWSEAAGKGERTPHTEVDLYVVMESPYFKACRNDVVLLHSHLRGPGIGGLQRLRDRHSAYLNVP